ncbi:MAG: hypothetical protein K9G58_01115 [Bacteroidales bacterium]|nr:hypothetical protein [Bacteroidales bacterium]MCF8396735.1 hypothetical protein [Bacteroidales bacterium]
MLKIRKSNVIRSLEIEVPFSKSISTRLLIMNALSDGLVTYDQLSDSDDSLRLKKNLEWIENCNISGIPTVLDAGNSGAVLRFMTAYLSLVPGNCLITGSKRLKERPIKELVMTLRNLGAHIEYAAESGRCPLLIRGGKLKGGETTMDLSQSSQFASAVLLVASETKNGVRLRFGDSPPSMSYINMTAELLRKAGIHVVARNNSLHVLPSAFKKVKIANEKDWSAASFWYELLMVSEVNEVFIPQLKKSELQGDAILPDVFQLLGIKTEFSLEGAKLSKGTKTTEKFSFDFRDNIDLALPVIFACAIRRQKAEFTGLDNLIYKESDRLTALLEILKSMNVRHRGDRQTTLELTGSEANKPGILDCRNDHRLIMSLVLLALHFGEIELKNHEEVEKSYPKFWEEMRKAGVEIINN